MTHQTLENILNNVNNSEYNYTKLLEIDEKVDFVNIHDSLCMSTKQDKYFDFYLLKNRDRQSKIKYVGIIYDMGYEDLHILILKDFRGKNYLKNSLETSILRYLYFEKDRKEQELTFKDDKVRQYFIEEFNFNDNSPSFIYKDLEDFFSNL